MLELIKTQHQRSAILLRKIEGDFTVASFITFDHLNNVKLLAQKILTSAELANILDQKESLKNRNVFIIEESSGSRPILIESSLFPDGYSYIEKVVLSPYQFNFFREAEFFSTQKTRGPN